jgi:hypothetical protein
MPKFMDKVYKNYVWIIIVLSLIGYFAYRVMSFDGTLESTVKDHNTWIQILFVIWLNVNMVSGAYDSGTSNGLNSEEFELADKLNNKLITNVNNEMKDFRAYVKALNVHELVTVQEDYLFSVGDKTVDELTEEERKEYDGLKPIRHNIYGFNLPLYYEVTKNGNVDYQASMKKNEGKLKKQIRKAFTGVLFGSMTVNMMFVLDNVGTAFVSLLIISVGLIITFLMTYFPQIFKFKYEIPKKVVLKNILYDSYVDYKQGNHKLKKTKEADDEEDNVNVVADTDTVSDDQLQQAEGV